MSVLRSPTNTVLLVTTTVMLSDATTTYWSVLAKTLFPVPESVLRNAMKGVRKVVVPEMNMGQYRDEIQRIAPAGAHVVGVNKMNTTLLSPQEIIEGGGLLS